MNNYRDLVSAHEQKLEDVWGKVKAVQAMLDEWRDQKAMSLTFAPFDREYSAELAESADRQYWIAVDEMFSIKLPDLQFDELASLYENVAEDYYFTKKQVK